MRSPVINSACKIKDFDLLQQVLKQPFIMSSLEEKMKWFFIGASNLITLYKVVEHFAVIRT